MNIHIDINLIVQFIEDSTVVELSATLINYKNNNYIISVHQGLPIKQIIINEIIIDNYIQCEWCDLLIIPVSSKMMSSFSNVFVFKQFVKTQLDTTVNYTTNHILYKYIESIFMPISMIPNNPSIMYNVMKQIEPLFQKAGTPICINNKLSGIIAKNKNDHIYSIPVNYILIALNKVDNTTIYMLDENIKDIYKINNYKVICDKIYCKLHKLYVPINCYIAVHGDSKYNCHIEYNNGRIKNQEICEFKNIILNKSKIILEKNNITISSGFFHWLKLDNKIDIIKKIFSAFGKSIECTINDNNYTIIYK